MTISYGHFDYERREYVVTEPMTPEPWINYLDGNGKMNAFISNGAGGTAWYDQPHNGRLTRYRLNGLPMDSPGFYLYIKDGAEIWNPSFFPVMKKLESWECRHGMGYTCFNASRNGIKSALKFFIPLKDEVLLWDLKLENTSSEMKELQIYPYIDYSLHGYIKDTLYFLVCGNQARYSYDESSGGLMSDYFAFEAPFMGKTIFSASERFEKFDMDRNRFIGRGRTEANPVGLEGGLQNTEVKDGGFFACGTFELNVKLKPREARRIIFKLAVSEDICEARRLSEKYSSVEEVDRAAKQVDERWEDLLSKCQVITPDKDVDVMLNAWLPKNIRSTMRNGRSISHRQPGDGSSLRFRDTMQDIMPGTMFYPEETRELILILMRSITASGRVVTGIDPATFTYPNPEHTRSDAIVWGVFTLYKYLAETGDTGILETVLPYYDKEEGSVLDHLSRGMRFVGENTGAHGLPKMFDCDWNDMLQVFSNAKTGGETVMLAEQFIYASKLLVEILRHAGKTDEIPFFEKKSGDFSGILSSDVCWDGGWFKRLLYPDAELGSSKNKEGKIFLNTQSWAAMAGTLPAAKVRKAMDNVSEMLDTECGIRLFTPPFTTMMDGVTRFHTNTPGAGENGGLFLHANTWAIIAEAMLGNPQRAWKYFSQILPNNLSARNPEHYGREPYALASWVYGPDHDAFGHAALTWLTGGAAWTYIAGTEYILGIRPTLDGLLVSPCIPPDWDKFEVQRRVRGATYRITVLNPDKVGCGNVHLTVDGSPLKGSLVPYAPAGKTVEVRAVISHAKQFANR
jgi:N,N'-diacetylchitobiose phosphorylase